MRPITQTTAKQYQEILAKAYPHGMSVGPDSERIATWRETTRRMLRYAIKRYWAEQGDERRGDQDAATISRGTLTDVAYKYPNKEELARLDKAARAPTVFPRHRAAFRILLGSGMRITEFLTLSRDDVEESLERGVLRVVGKGNKERVIDSRPVRAAFEVLLTLPALANGPWEYVGDVYGGAGTSLDTRAGSIDKWLRRLAQGVGLDPSSWSPHRLRHGFAIRNVRKVSLEYLQKHLGHASIAITGRYLHADPAEGANLVSDDF